MGDSSPAQPPRVPPADLPPRVTPAELCLAFAALTLQSFGGALFWSRRMLVEQRRWLTDQEFVEVLAVAQLLPGANGVNLAVVVGYRFARFRGAIAALAGFFGPPLVIISALGVLHHLYGALPLVQDALRGMAAVAVGLVIAVAAKMAPVLGRRALPWTFVVLTFAGVGLLRLPLLIVVGVLAPFAIGAAWKGHY